MLLQRAERYPLVGQRELSTLPLAVRPRAGRRLASGPLGKFGNTQPVHKRHRQGFASEGLAITNSSERNTVDGVCRPARMELRYLANTALHSLERGGMDKKTHHRVEPAVTGWHVELTNLPTRRWAES
jgi:hypothetical protein